MECGSTMKEIETIERLKKAHENLETLIDPKKYCKKD